MWLINVDTLQLENFVGNDVWTTRPYAILSHTWEDEEVTHQDMRDLSLARNKVGFWKIEKTCEQAKEDRLGYAWVDTCCIDKTSSTELQEAINSMFEWYAHAMKCYALLSDVKDKGSVSSLEKDLMHSRWFSRGWTLQELIAPTNVHFMDQSWKPLGSRSSLEAYISKRTKIHSHLMKEGQLFEFDRNTSNHDLRANRDSRWLGRYSMAQRMSWAASRQTTRVEDRAYSLLGILGVSMPLLYGEGRKSFIRLQEEILRSNRSVFPDLSLLLWEVPKEHDQDRSREEYFQCLLANSPDAFSSCGNLVFDKSDVLSDVAGAGTDLTITSFGIKARIPVLPLPARDNYPPEFAAVLNCYDQTDLTSAIALRLVGQTQAVFEDQNRNEGTYALHVTAYSRSQLANLRVNKRTIAIDAVEAQQNTVINSLFLPRENESASGRPDLWFKPVLPNPFPAHVKVPDLPERIWLRFNAGRTTEMHWASTERLNTGAWSFSKWPNALFKPYEYNRNIMNARRIMFRRQAFERPCIVGATAYQNVNRNCRHYIVITIACTLDKVGQGSKGPIGGLTFFRIDAVNDRRYFQQQGDLKEYRDRLMNEDVQEDRYDYPFERFLTLSTKSKLGPGAKAVHLVDPKVKCDCNIFAIRPQTHYFAGRPVVVLQVEILPSMEDFELDAPAPAGGSPSTMKKLDNLTSMEHLEVDKSETARH